MDETPILKQYRSIKAEHPNAILMFRIGDFFEMLEGDAEIAARELELTLTSKSLGKAGRLPLAGVPHHSAESYIARLVRKGYHIAVCDQTETAKNAKGGLVRREVMRVVTPGTYDGADGRENKFIAASDGTSLAICDLLTGELYVGAFSDDLLARYKPAEILLSDSVENVPMGYFITRVPDWKFAPDLARETIKKQFGVVSLDGLGLGSESNVVGGLLLWLGETQKSALSHIASIKRVDENEVVRLDASTLLQLEIIDSPSREKETTLLHLLDHAITAPGSRLIARRLTAPLKDPVEIRARLSLVEAFHNDSLVRENIRATLKRVFDLERLAGRVSLGTISPREVVGLASSLEAVPDLRKDLVHAAFDSVRPGLDPLPDLTRLIREHLVDEPPIEIGQGALFRDGVSPKLDELRHGSRASRQWIAELQQKERDRTGINSLKVGFNNVFGYYIEITKSNLDKVPADYARKQTMSTGERYITEDLKHHEDVVLRANERIVELEQELFNELRRNLLPFLARIKATAEAVAVVDLSAAFADVAERRRFVKPEIIESERAVFRVERGRHPMVEALRSGEESFVPNDCAFENDARFMVLTGPNMAGKSTYIRQAALIALMAQIGSFVPAEKCVMTPFHGIHARIGASDRLARGLSTFMVEMTEAAAILRTSTPKSLVILDEIGRGTSTYDGLAIAWSIVEALAARGSLSLFATHYHELTALSETIPGVFNMTVAVREWNDNVHFLHEIRPGAADRSYGIAVASIAGVPPDVLRRAREILTELELSSISRANNQLSLFSAPPPERDKIRDELSELDLDNLTPRDAHATLARWKENL